MSNIKIGVIGSCVSRDAFNSNFIKDYKQFYKCVFTQNHMSMIALVSDPVPFNPQKIGDEITDFNKHILMSDLIKSAWDSLKILEPDYLILDFYADVYLGIIKVGDSYLTDKTWLYNRTTFFDQFKVEGAMKIENNYEKYMELWKRSVDKFMERMEREFPNIKIIINKVHFTDFYITKDGKEKKRISESGKYKKIDVDQINGWLDEFYNYFEENYDVAAINYDKEYLSDENHIWEFFYVHYTQDFYEDFTTKLLHIILNDLYYKANMNVVKNKKEISTGNLLRNPSFNLGKSFWTYWQKEFVIRKPEPDKPKHSIVTIKQSGLKKKAYRQLWSHPVEINTSGNQVYSITFDIKIEDIRKVDSDRIIFSLRTFNKVHHVLQDDSVWHENIRIEDIKNLRNNKWVTFKYIFKPSRGKFLKVGPYLMQNGTVSWRNIKLEKVPENNFFNKITKVFSIKKIVRKMVRIG